LLNSIFLIKFPSFENFLIPNLSAEELDMRIKQRINEENKYLDGKTFLSFSTLNRNLFVIYLTSALSCYGTLELLKN
jgi:hypothetical protein